MYIVALLFLHVCMHIYEYVNATVFLKMAQIFQDLTDKIKAFSLFYESPI